MVRVSKQTEKPLVKTGTFTRAAIAGQSLFPKRYQTVIIGAATNHQSRFREQSWDAKLDNMW